MKKNSPEKGDDAVMPNCWGLVARSVLAGLGMYLAGTIIGPAAFRNEAALAAERQDLPLEIVGRASVIDGDTLEIHGTRIRLNGIDAPESDQLCAKSDGGRFHCGSEAANFLDRFIDGSSPIRCLPVGRDRYGRTVADCRRADGIDLASHLVRSGWALDWRKYSHGRFAEEERAAQSERLGLWAGEFDIPWEYRASRRR